jgi:hypothetical protein
MRLDLRLHQLELRFHACATAEALGFRLCSATVARVLRNLT